MLECALQKLTDYPAGEGLARSSFVASAQARFLMSRFISSLDCKDSTKELYAKAARYFLEWMDEKLITTPTVETLIRFKSWLRSKDLSPNTVNSYLVGIKRLFMFFEKSGYYPNIAKDIKGFKQASGHLRDAFSKHEIRDILNAIDTSTQRGKRDYAIINLMARTGLRTIEVASANYGDLRINGEEGILYIKGKGREAKDEFVLLTKESLTPLLEYLEDRGQVPVQAALFVSLSNRNKESRLTTRAVRGIICNHKEKIESNNRRLSAHSLRHFFATCSLQSGAPVLQVKDALRHKSVETTQRYLHNLERIENGAERFIEI